LLRLSSTHRHLWDHRIQQNVHHANITEVHARILRFVYDSVEGGEDQLSHKEIAAAVRRGLSCVKDALRRGKELGALTWEKRFVLVHGKPRQVANRYRIMLPESEPVPRPDIRRHRTAVGVRRPSEEVSYQAALEGEGRGFVQPLTVIAAAREARFHAEWAAKRVRLRATRM